MFALQLPNDCGVLLLTRLIACLHLSKNDGRIEFDAESSPNIRTGRSVYRDSDYTPTNSSIETVSCDDPGFIVYLDSLGTV